MKRFWSLLLAFLLIPCLAVTASAAEYSGTCGENLTWEFDRSTATLTISGTGPMENYEKLRTGHATTPWTGFLPKKIVIEEGVTSIGNFAFYSTDYLKTVQLPDGIKSIGRYAFHSCIELKSVTVGDGLERLGKQAFGDCFKLASISLPDTLTQIGEGTFYRCNALEEMVLPEKLESIPDEAFYECRDITSLVIPKSVASVGSRAFRYCNALTYVTYTGTTAEQAKIVIGKSNSELKVPDWECSDGVVPGRLAVPTMVMGYDDFDGGSCIKVEGYPTVRVRVYRADKKSGPYEYIGYTRTGFEFTDPKAVGGKTYYYKVRAVDPETGIMSKRSAAQKLTHKLPCPWVAVKNHGDTGKPLVTWEKIYSAVNYHIYRSGPVSDWDGSIDGLKFTRIASTTSQKYHDKSAKAGKIYVYKVKAVAKDTDYSSTTKAYDSIYCRIPTPEITVTLNDSGKPRIRWEAVPGAVEYSVYRCTTENGTYKYLKSTEKTAVTDTTAKAGQKYYYTVRALDKEDVYSEFAWAKSVTAK